MTDRPPPADWQLPAGVDRGLWDYLQSSTVARGYDASLAGSTLFAADEEFCRRHFPVPGRLIDLGCGTGRLLLVFAQRGYSVLGVDLSAEMLAVSREKAAVAALPVRLLRANIADLNAVGDQTFDYAACLFSTLGMVSGKDARQGLVGQAFRVLKPGGRFVVHVHNRWFNALDPVGRRWLVTNFLGSVLRRSKAGNRVMPVHQGVTGLTLHLFTRREAVRLLREAGFRIVAVKAIGLGNDGELAWPGFFAWLRAYGYLVAAEKPVAGYEHS